jgi:phosphate/sulfate permease
MNPIMAIAKYNKFIVAVLGAVSVGLTSFEHGQPWVATVLGGISAVLVYLVPNKQQSTIQIKMQTTMGAEKTYNPEPYGTPAAIIPPPPPAA